MRKRMEINMTTSATEVFRSTRWVAAVLIATLGLSGCRPDTSGLVTLDLEQLVELLAAENSVVLCDANSPETRERFGVIPGAVLLSNYRDYDAPRELPADRGRKLVFYCHSEMCGAGVEAARVAVAAGYSDVAVYPGGIAGWRDADQPVQQLDAHEGQES
jgi:rhodanese-related sulfurtransferase